MATPRVGLVLGAGGVVGGAFHAGVLSALEEATGWDPRGAEVVVGTSAGSLTGAFLRAGFSAVDLAARALGKPVSPEGARILQRLGPIPDPSRLDFGNFGRGAAAPSAVLWAALQPWRVRPGAVAAAILPEGRTPTDPLRRMIEGLYAERWPGAAFRVCTVRLGDARRIVFGGKGEPGATVGQAVAASCAIPAVFEPVRIGGAKYVDGGAHSPTNLDVVGSLGLDLVLVSSPMSAAGRHWRLSADLALRRLCRARLAREAASLRRRGTGVLAFQPTAEDQKVMGLNPMNPERRSAVTAQARESTLRRLGRPDVRRRLARLSQRE